MKALFCIGITAVSGIAGWCFLPLRVARCEKAEAHMVHLKGLALVCTTEWMDRSDGHRKLFGQSALLSIVWAGESNGT